MHLIVAAAFFWLSSLTEVTGTWRCNTCPISYEAIGCFKDEGQRPLPSEILNERDTTSKYYDGHLIDWLDWNNYMGEFACRCAAKTKERGWRVFGLQFYGECWSGLELDSYTTMNKSDKCLGAGYKKCHPLFDRHCVGQQFTNMVYKIVPECDVKFERLGCYRDPHSQPRPLPEYIMTDRDGIPNVSSGRSIGWRNWDAYMPELACRCAKKAKERGDDTFGLQFFGECWSGAEAVHTYNNKGSSSSCIDKCYETCDPHDTFCAGIQVTNFVYRLSDAPCEVSLEEVGCFNEDLSNRGLEKELVNQIYPPSPVFNGHYMDDQNWHKEFPKFLCRCARAAKEGGFIVFGVHNHGSCWTTHDPGKILSYGKSSECFKNVENPCTPEELKCAGGPNTHFIYEIKP